MLFFLRLDDVRRRSNWPADPRTILCVPALMESLLGECSLDFAGLPGEPVYAGSTALSSPRATRSCVFVCCPRKSVNKIIDLSSSMLDHLGHLGWAIKAELHLIPRVRVGFRNFQGMLFMKLLVAKHDGTVSERYTYIRSVLLAMSYDIA